MAKLEQTIDEIGALLADVDEIAANVRKAQTEMVLRGPKSIDVDVATAIGHIAWLKNWAEKVASTPEKQRKAKATQQKAKALREKLKERTKKS